MPKAKPFPQVLKGAATAASNNPQRTGRSGPRYKKPTMPKMPWDDKEEKMEQLTEQERREAYIKAYVYATLSPTEKENWHTVKRQRDVAARVYDTECKWSLK